MLNLRSSLFSSILIAYIHYSLPFWVNMIELKLLTCSFQRVFFGMIAALLLGWSKTLLGFFHWSTNVFWVQFKGSSSQPTSSFIIKRCNIVYHKMCTCWNCRGILFNEAICVCWKSRILRIRPSGFYQYIGIIDFDYKGGTEYSVLLCCAN